MAKFLAIYSSEHTDLEHDIFISDNHKVFGWSRELELAPGDLGGLPENTFYGEFGSINLAYRSFWDLLSGADQFKRNKLMVCRVIVVRFTMSRSFSDYYAIRNIEREH